MNKSPTLWIFLGCALLLPPAASAQSGLPGGQRLSCVPQILEGGAATNFVIGTTNATIAPIYLGNVDHIGWEGTAQTTNTTSTVTVLFAVFEDISGDWPTAVSNCAASSLRQMTIPATTSGVTVGTNYAVDGYQWMVPLYITNASQMVSNLTLRYFLKNP